MTTFLLGLSLFLNLLALFSVIILFLRQNRLSEVEKKQEMMIREMEEVISSYLVQMKEENEQFLERIRKVDRKEKQTLDKQSEVLANTIEIEDESLKEKQLKELTGKVPIKKAAMVYQKYAKTKSVDISTVDKVELPPIEMIQEEKEDIHFIKKQEKNEGHKEQSLLSQALNLQNQGFSEEEIAKKLNRGKTEIVLLLKFNQNS